MARVAGRIPAIGLALAAVTAPACRTYLVVRAASARSEGRIVTDANRIDADVAAVLGAGLRPDGTPTKVLADRVEAGAALFRAGSVRELVMSGDDNDGGDQPGAMRRLAVGRGVPSERIELDRTGVDTAATCRTLRASHGDRRVVLVTQEFHAARTSYLAARAGLDAVVLATPDATVRPKARVKARIREVPASVKAVFVDRF